ncbi:MAG TPA: maleylpyruvate isomerase family mycothiol-dependent enzyme [Jiangellaceae bacterium]
MPEMKPTTNGTPADEPDNEPDRVVGPVSAATEALVATAESLDDDGLRSPSLCPGWTRGHVLAHVARNADALANLLNWANTGVETPMYPSAEARNADIQAGSTRAPAELAEDLKESAAGFAKAVSAMPEQGWERLVRTGPAGAGSAIPARRVMWLRLREVEIHHVDLNAGYRPSDWPSAFVDRALRESLRTCGRKDGVPPFTAVADGIREHVGGPGGPTVSGTAPALLAWLTGRSSGTDLTVDGDALPELPAGAWL